MTKVYILIVILFLLGNSAFANGVKTKELNLKFCAKNQETKSPTYELFFYANGKQIAKRVFHNGELVSKEGEIPDGVIIERYNNGRPKNVLLFKEGKRNGNAIGFYESGKLKKIVTFKDDKPVGESKMYYENGNLLMESRIENGKQVFYRDYYPNGQLKQEVHEQGDKIIRKMYDAHGQIVK